MTEAEAKAEGFELEDYETEVLEIWPDNETAFAIFQRIGTRWRFPAMGGAPMGFQWEAVYPLMERLGLADVEWNQLHDDLMLMESAALETIRKFAPKD